jgi:hypothetical protein
MLSRHRQVQLEQLKSPPVQQARDQLVKQAIYDLTQHHNNLKDFKELLGQALVVLEAVAVEAQAHKVFKVLMVMLVLKETQVYKVQPVIQGL